MKKTNIILLILLALSINFKTLQVKADDDKKFGITYTGFPYDGEKLENDVQLGRTAPVCEYIDATETVRTGIYLKFSQKVYDEEDPHNLAYALWSIVHRSSDTSTLKNLTINNKIVSAGLFQDLFIEQNKDNNKHIIHNKAYIQNGITTFECKPYASYGRLTDGANTDRAICFHDGINQIKTECGENFQPIGNTFSLRKEKSVYYEIQSYATTSSGIYKDITFNNYYEYYKKGKTLDDLIADLSRNYMSEKYLFNDKYIMPWIITDFTKDKKCTHLNNTAFDTFQTQMEKKIDAAYKNGQISLSEKNLLLNQFKNDVSAYQEEADKNKAPITYPSKSDDFTTNCADFAPTIRFGGYILFIAKILLPIIILVKSSLNIISIVTKGTPDELSKQAKKFGVSCLASIIIFFTPTLVNTIFSIVSGFNMTDDSKICSSCIFDPFSETCTVAVEGE